MYVNNKKMINDGVEVDILITEFFPSIGDDELTVVPVSKLGGKFPFYAFGEVKPDALSTGPFQDEDILDLDEYVKEIKSFLKEVREISDNKIELFFDLEQMYQRYVNSVSMLAISGVSSITISDEDVTIETFADAPEFTPADGLEYKLDLESYWKSLMFVIPNIVADTSTTLRMYANYIRSNKFSSKQKSYSSNLVLKVKSISELVDLVNSAMDRTDLTPKQISNLVADGDVVRSPDMTEYYKFMLNSYNIGQVQATGLLLYAFESHYERVYENGDIIHLYEEETPLVLSLPKSNVVRKTVSHGLL